MNKIYTLFLLLLVSVTVTNAQSGVLDPSFGNDGIVATVISGTYNLAHATVVQPDGKIIVVGQAGEPATYKVAVARYNTDGSLDTTFGNNGTLIIEVGPAKSYGTAVALQEDGKIVIGAYTWDNVTGDFALIRLNEDGSFDNSFGHSGIVIANSNRSEVSETMVILDDGKILLGGYSDDNFAVAKFNADGTIDTSFGANGYSITTFMSSPSFIKKIALQSDGKIVLAGFLINESNIYEMAVARLNTDGTLDNSFGTDGKISFNIGNGNDYLEGVAIQDDGKILLGGHKWIMNFGLRHDLAVVRLHENGSFDTTYGDNGVATARLVDGANYSRDILLQPDNKVIISGFTVLEEEYNMAMARFDSDGNLDDTFGIDGMVSTNIHEDYSNAITLQGDNKIILAGYSYNASGASEFIVARYDNQVLGTEDFQHVKLRLYPNPANEQITIELNDGSSNYQLEIFNILGEKVIVSEIQKSKQIDVSALASGVYLVKLNSNSQTTTVRFVKQ